MYHPVKISKAYKCQRALGKVCVKISEERIGSYFFITYFLPTCVYCKEILMKN